MTSRPSQKNRWRSKLWRRARRVPLPPNWTFNDLWLGLFGIFLVALMFARREGMYDTIERLLSCVSHMRVSDYVRKLLGLSPTSPKPKQGQQDRDSRGHATAPVEVASKGLGCAGDVEIPLGIWDRLVPDEAVEAMSAVEVPLKDLPEAEFAMVCALERQNHLVPIGERMPGSGLKPSAPIFVIPKTDEKCSFIFNCKLGNKAYDGPNPPMKLPNLLCEKFLSWSVQRRARQRDRYLVKLDLTNCYPSLKLPMKAWGSFRVQGSEGVSDLRSLPFGWRFSPPICQETVTAVLQRVLRRMPLPQGYESWDDVDYDHYLDDLLFVETDREWLEACGPLLARYLQIEGFIISQKSVLGPVSVAD